MKRKRKAKIVATLGPASATRGAPAPLVGHRIHTSPIRNAFHGVARRAGSRATPRCEGWPRRREIECPRPALSSALTSCAFVSFVVKAMPQQTTPRYTNQYAFRRSDAAANRDFEPGFEGPTGVGASISMFCASLHLFLPVTANYLPVMAKSSPCYRPVPRAPPIFLKALLLKLIFLQKPVRRPPILPVSCLLSGSIRENRGAKPLFNPGFDQAQRRLPLRSHVQSSSRHRRLARHRPRLRPARRQGRSASTIAPTPTRRTRSSTQSQRRAGARSRSRATSPTRPTSSPFSTRRRTRWGG